MFVLRHLLPACCCCASSTTVLAPAAAAPYHCAWGAQPPQAVLLQYWCCSEPPKPTILATGHPSLSLQADVIIDETYAENPTTYDSAALLKEWSLTEAEAAALPAWANKKVRARWLGEWTAASAWFTGSWVLGSHTLEPCSAWMCSTCMCGCCAAQQQPLCYASVFLSLCHRCSTSTACCPCSLLSLPYAKLGPLLVPDPPLLCRCSAPTACCPCSACPTSPTPPRPSTRTAPTGLRAPSPAPARWVHLIWGHAGRFGGVALV